MAKEVVRLGQIKYLICIFFYTYAENFIILPDAISKVSMYDVNIIK